MPNTSSRHSALPSRRTRVGKQSRTEGRFLLVGVAWLSAGLCLVQADELRAPSGEQTDGQAMITIRGERKQWHTITLSLDGPKAQESDPSFNPFTDCRMTVMFRHRSGAPRYIVPGYFATDGQAADSSAVAGTTWRAHLSPDKPGIWDYEVSFIRGHDVAIREDSTGSTCAPYHGATGQFTISPTDKTGRDFRHHGRLQYVNGHHLRFAGSGVYFLKGGADSPENFLAYNDIDGTYDASADSGSYSHIGGFIHRYQPHVRDWRTGDPTWQNDKGKGIIGALNYLADKGMNSVYFLTYNLDGGDGRDTWMWTTVDERERFDCSKLDQWEMVFEHMDHRGIMLHVVTQETENDQKLGGSPGLNRIRKLYYRELVARFSHHLAVIWNLGEENNTPDPERKAIAAYIRRLDPYHHPITVHSHNNQALRFYDGILGDGNMEATSIQGDLANYNQEAIAMRKRSAAAGRKWVIFGDEQAPASHGVVPDADDPAHDCPRQLGLWGNLMGGGSGVEWYFGHQFPHMDINCENWRSREIMWDQTRHALTFFQQYLPFWEMVPDNDLATATDAMVLTKPGSVYAVYLPGGGTTELSVASGTYRVQWYDPIAGGDLLSGSVSTVAGPGRVALGRPPDGRRQDWAALLRRE